MATLEQMELEDPSGQWKQPMEIPCLDIVTLQRFFEARGRSVPQAISSSRTIVVQVVGCMRHALFIPMDLGS